MRKNKAVMQAEKIELGDTSTRACEGESSCMMVILYFKHVFSDIQQHYCRHGFSENFDFLWDDMIAKYCMQ